MSVVALALEKFLPDSTFSEFVHRCETDTELRNSAITSISMVTALVTPIIIDRIYQVPHQYEIDYITALALPVAISAYTGFLVGCAITDAVNE